MDRGDIITASDLNLVLSVLRERVQASDLGAGEDLFAVDDINSSGAHIVDFFRQCFQREIQIPQVINVMIGVQIPAFHSVCVSSPCVGIRSAVGGDIRFKHPALVDGISATDSISDAGDPSGIGVDQKPS